MKNYTLIILFLVFQNLFGQDENLSLDTTFGQDGLVQMSNYKSADYGVIDFLENIYVTVRNLRDEPEIIKFSQDGILDQNFGNNGKITFGPDARNVKAKHIENKIFALVERYYYYGNGNFDIKAELHCFNLNGTIDESFATGGIFKLFPEEQPQFMRPGQIFKMGNDFLFTCASSGFKTYFVKFDESGELDSTFGDNGILIAPFTPTGLALNYVDFKIDNGNIYAVGSDNATMWFVSAKYDQNFNLDENYGDNGLGSHYVYDSTVFWDVTTKNFLINDDFLYVSGHKTFRQNTNVKYHFIYTIDKNTGIVTDMYDKYFYDGDDNYSSTFIGEASLLYDENKIIIGGNAQWSGSSSPSTMVLKMIDMETQNVYSKEFNFDAKYFNFIYQGGNRFLALGYTASTHELIISRHHLNENMNSSELDQIEAISIYPNPAQNLFYVSSKGKIAQVRLFNGEGKLLKQYKYNNDGYDIQGLNDGSYFVSIIFENKEILNKKLIIKK